MEEILHLINEMSPFLLLGFLLAGLMHAFIPGDYYSRYLSKPTFRSVVNAALFGIPIPLCSCGVIPTAMSLRQEGASKGAVTSFLIATPQTGVDSILATYSLMGWPFAVIRPIAALATALLGGAMVNFGEPCIVRSEELEVRSNSKHVEHHHEKHDHCECGHDSCGCCEEVPAGSTFVQKLGIALKYAFVEMMQDIGKWLIIGLVVAGLITVLVPDSVFTFFEGNTFASMLVVLLIAIPMYLCATGSIPIAVALMLKGLTPGAGLVLLMAGPACNMASILVVRKVLGTKTLALYLGSIIIGAIGFGCLIDYLQFSGTVNFLGALVMKDACCVEEGTSWFRWFCTATMFILLAHAFWKAKHGGHHHHHAHGECHCHEHEEGHCHCHENNNSNNNETMDVRIYHVEGMNCNHCRTAAEKALLNTPGVTSASVDLASKEARVEGTATEEQLRAAVEAVGFSLVK